MIIKSMSRSSTSFASLYDYLTRDSDSELDGHNLYSSPHDKKAIVDEFMKNADFLQRARGKNYLYHEIISLSKNNLPSQEQQKILQDLAQEYLSKRAGQHLAFTALHKDKEHMHIHLMISANEITGDKRIRFSKDSFASIQKELETYLNERYPQLNPTEHYQKSKADKKTPRKEQEMKSRKKAPSRKDELYETLRMVFEKATSEEYFKNTLKNRGIDFYIRGKTAGIVFEDKKYRLNTLGLQTEYNQFVNKLERIKNRKEKRAESKIDSRREQMNRTRTEKSTVKPQERQKE
jgi:hypothetical protein